MSQVISLRIEDERLAAFQEAATAKGYAKLAEWLKVAGDAYSGYCPPAGQVPYTPNVPVEVEPVNNSPQSECMVPFDPTKGEVTVEPLHDVSQGKTRPFDPNGGPVTYEPVKGLLASEKMKAFDKNAGPVTTHPVQQGVYSRKHHPRCPCLMCTGKPDKTEISKTPNKSAKYDSKGQSFTGESVVKQGHTYYEVETERGKRWTIEAPTP